MNNITIKAKDGADIAALTVGFEDKTPRAALIICHGFGEHAACYVELADALRGAGFACIIHNQRGHGEPPEDAKKWFGIIPGYHSFTDDVLTLTDYVREALPGVPVVLYGHSMGGNIVLNTLLSLPREQASQYTCAVLEAPWLGLYAPPNAFLAALLRLIDKIAPNLIIEHKLRHADLSNVKERVDGYGKDPLYHGFLSARMITGIFTACRYALDNAAKLSVPTFLAYADNDLVVCNKAIAEFASAAGGVVKLKEYASKHAIHNDENREQFIRDIVGYIGEAL